MVQLDIKRLYPTDDKSEVHELLAAAEQADGIRPLSDHMWLDLRQGGRPGFAALLGLQSGHGHALAYCQVSRGNDSWSLDLVIHPGHRTEMATIGPQLLERAVRIVADEGGGHVHWWVFQPNETHAELAQAINFVPGRSLLQMRVPLPLAAQVVSAVKQISTREFRVGVDEENWLAANNRAFMDHPEQGGWTLEILQSREREPWFDPHGFLLHDENHQLAGFCWTKLHPATNPMLGEIYVVAVDPQFAGRGLGRALTAAGLQHLTTAGAVIGMLYVDSQNAAAVSMYATLGFTTHFVQRAYVGDIGPSSR
ncbi:MAG: mycothiol synthase [Ilumatobacteraceae bacterium]